MSKPTAAMSGLKPVQELKAWAVVNKDGEIVFKTIATTEANAWHEMWVGRHQQGFYQCKQGFIDEGYTVQPVTVTAAQRGEESCSDAKEQGEGCFRAVRAERVLRELVDCKALKDSIGYLDPELKEAARNEYMRRKTKAWDDARALTAGGAK